MLPERMIAPTVSPQSIANSVLLVSTAMTKIATTGSNTTGLSIVASIPPSYGDINLRFTTNRMYDAYIPLIP
jgi:hypothetical protein